MRGGRSTINDGAGDRFRDFFETSTPDTLNLLSKYKAQESALFLAHRELHAYNRNYIPYCCKLSPIQSHSFGLTEYRTFLGRWCGVLSFFPLRVVVRGRVTLHILHYLDSNRTQFIILKQTNGTGYFVTGLYKHVSSTTFIVTFTSQETIEPAALIVPVSARNRVANAQGPFQMHGDNVINTISLHMSSSLPLPFKYNPRKS